MHLFIHFYNIDNFYMIISKIPTSPYLLFWNFLHLYPLLPLLRRFRGLELLDMNTLPILLYKLRNLCGKDRLKLLLLLLHYFKVLGVYNNISQICLLMRIPMHMLLLNLLILFCIFNDLTFIKKWYYLYLLIILY